MNARTDGASDADPAIAGQMAAVMAPWPDAMVIDTEGGGVAGGLGGLVQQVLDAIRPHGPEYVWRPARPFMLPG